MSLSTASTPRPSRGNRFDHFPEGRKLLTCFYPVNDPQIPVSLLDIYRDAGVDIVELGLPVENPYMDGATVTDSLRRTLATEDYMQKFAQAAERIAAWPVPAAQVCMTYADFPRDLLYASSAWDSIDGLLMVGLAGAADRPEVESFIESRAVRPVHFIDYDLDPEMIDYARGGASYIMLQAVAGKTGTGRVISSENREKIARLRQQGLHQPILLGFGISEPDQVRDALSFGADGVIIGSACIEKALKGPEALRDYLHAVREALDEG